MEDTFGLVRPRGKHGQSFNRGGSRGYSGHNNSYSNGRGGRGGRGGGGGQTYNSNRSAPPVEEKDYDLFDDVTPPPTSPPLMNQNSSNDHERRGNRNNGTQNRNRGRQDGRREQYSRREASDRDDNSRRSYSPPPQNIRPQSFVSNRPVSPESRNLPPMRYPPRGGYNGPRRDRRSPSTIRNGQYNDDRQPSSSRYGYQDEGERKIRERLEDHQRDVESLEQQLFRARKRVDDDYEELKEYMRKTEELVATVAPVVLSPDSIEVSNFSDQPSTSTTQFSQDISNQAEEDKEGVMQNLTNQIRKTVITPQLEQYVSSDRSTEVCEKLKPARITSKNRVNILTNYWDVEVGPKIVYRYDVTVHIILNDKGIEISGGPKNDATQTERHKICLAALRVGLETYAAFRRQAGTVYDGATQLYTSEEIQLADSGSITIKIPAANLPPYIAERYKPFSGMKVEISPNISMPHFDIANFSKENNRDLSENDKVITNFLNMLTNESAQRNGLTVFGSGRIFDMGKECENIGRGQERRMGIDKGIKFIEGGISRPGNSGRNNDRTKKPSLDSNTIPALLLDAKCGMFFTNQSVFETVKATFGNNININWKDVQMQKTSDSKRIRNPLWVELNQYLRGLRFLKTDQNNIKRDYTISGISEYPIEELSFVNFRGTEETVLGHLEKQIKEDIRHINGRMPAVMVRAFDKTSNETKKLYFAMETIILSPNQRVPISKQTEPPRPIRVQDRWERIQKLIGELNLEQGERRNEIMKLFGVSLSETAKKIVGVRREAPKVIFANGKQAEMAINRCDWKSGDQQALDPAKCSSVIVSYPKRDYNIAMDAKEALSRKCGQMGVHVSQWFMMDVDQFPGQNDHKRILSLFEHVAKSKQKYGQNPLILFIDWEKSKSHDSLKLAERRSVTVSQQLTMEKAKMLKRQQMTCANVVKKLNVKMGGLNYRVDPEIYAQSQWLGKEPILIISYDVAHPGKVDKNEAVLVPSVVGFSFNGGTHPEAFVGDFHFQYPKLEQVDSQILSERIKWMLDAFIKNRNCWPTKVLVIRDGVSEGQYKMVMREELEALKEGCREFGNLKNRPDWCPPFGLVVATKRHSTRLFKERNGAVENCQPLTVVDQEIVKPQLNEAFIVSAHALQGTSRPVCYTMLKNEIGMKDMDEFESIMLGLTFHHQITDSPISLPEPVYQADEWAKRGNNMWKAFDKFYTIPRSNKRDADFEEMTKNLAFWKTPLSGKRVNA